MKNTSLVKMMKKKDYGETCESCGAMNIEKCKDNYWKDKFGRVICGDCMTYPTDILKEIYKFKSISKIRKKIKDFDEECDESFLELN